jgi:hypothetical protein
MDHAAHAIRTGMIRLVRNRPIQIDDSLLVIPLVAPNQRALKIGVPQSSEQKRTLTALGLVVNVLVLWNTLYMDAALAHLRRAGAEVKPDEGYRPDSCVFML